MQRRKKAQSEGGSVAVIIIIIALFMTLYILFISPEERARILNPENDTDSDSSASYNKVELLAESPGLVSPTNEFASVHSIPSINVFNKEEPVIQTLANNLQVSKSISSENSPILKFNIEHIEETTSANIVFSIEDASGELFVNVNDHLVYSGEIKNSVAIIEIPKQYLLEKNKVKLSVSSPGVEVWKTNKYNLKDVNFKQEFVLKNNEEARSVTITAKEKLTLLKTRLKYTQICNTPLASAITRFEIFVNDQRAHSADIRCITTEEEIEIDNNFIKEGQNQIIFKLEKGDFSFNLIKLETDSRETQRPTYFFTLNDKQIKDINANKRKIKLHALLDRQGYLKNARFTINSNDILMQTDKTKYDLDLKDYILEGTNFIKINPVNSFTITGLKVSLE